jgi:ABC-2 type transport system permease protein
VPGLELAPARSRGRARIDRTGGAGVALARRAFLDSQVWTIGFAYLFAIYSYIQPAGYRGAYPTASDRIAFARSFATNKGLRLLYGQPHDVATVAGYTAWRVGGVLAIAAALYGLLVAVRATRGEEDSGRLELVLAGSVSRHTVSLAAVAAIGLGIGILWVAELVGYVTGGLPVGGSAYLALATISVIPVCAGIGAVGAQLAPSRRIALELGGIVVAVLFVMRVIADTVTGFGWLRWATPLGWAEELRPFAGPQPVVLLLPIVTTGLLLFLAARLSAARDVGTGVLPARDTAEPKLRLLGSATAQGLRGQRGPMVAWAITVAAFSFILGTVAKSISPADVSKSLQKEIAKLGSGAITTPTGYLAFLFSIFAVAICAFVCLQVGSARQEETDQRLETLLALPLDRRRWLAGRLAIALGAAAVLALGSGLLGWAGATAGGATISLPRMLEAGANALPVSILFLGIAALAYAIAPRPSPAISYGLLALAYLWQLAGSLLAAPKWLLDLTPFAHVALVPAQPFRTASAAILIAIGVIAAALAVIRFDARDLIAG